MERFRVSHSAGSYPVYAGADVLDGAFRETLDANGWDRVFLVSDSNVFPLYGERVMKLAGGRLAGFTVFEAGERNKTLTTVSGFYEAFAKAGLTRRSAVAALGGGVCGDMAGFAAATYLRGMDVIQLPTTLLAQIDSSIGGKTGVDLPFGKNLVGAFKQPAAVIADSTFLDTLPERVFRDGMGEAVKCGLIADADGLFGALRDGSLGRADLIARCMKIKADVVSADERECGLRMVLNYGHTVGHAIETLGGFERFTHGEAVGLGMLWAAKIGGRVGYPPLEGEIREVLSRYGLPVEDGYPAERLLEVMHMDKKRTDGGVSFILLEKIGRPVIRKLTFGELEKLMREE